jgi:hypothetical protein
MLHAHHQQPEATSCSRRNRSRQRTVLVAGAGLALIFFVLMSASAQEALDQSQAGDAAAQARITQSESQPYTIKDGDFKLLVVPSLGLDWNDNINITKTNALSDFILEPRVQLDASYPVSDRNLLSLNLGVGYDEYLDHPGYSTWYLSSDSGLSFDIYVNDFWFNLHDRASYVQDTAQNPQLSGTADYATIVNTAGLSATWDLNQLTLSSGYDHQNTIATTSQYDSQNNAAEMLFAKAGAEVYPGVTPGVEVTTAFTTYQQATLNNNDAYTAGGYVNWQPGSYFSLQSQGGLSTYRFQHTSQSVRTDNLNSWYCGLTITHQPTDAISYTLAAGHEVQLGIQSDATEDWYVRPTIQWNIIKNVSLHTSFSYENGTQGVGNVSGNQTDTFDWMYTEVGASYSVLKKLSLGLNYRLTIRSSSTSNDGYTQNVVGFTLTYQP